MLSAWRAPTCSACRLTGALPSGRLFSSSPASCSGSNKWSKIKHKKAANDAAKSNMYGALSREIIAAVRTHPSHSTSPEANPRLAMLLKKAKDLDVSRDKIEMTLKKAESAGTGGSSVTYEALGPATKDGTPVAMIIECQTDAPSRTMAKVKEAINKHKGRLSATSHLFQRTGIIRLTINGASTFDSVWETAVEHGAEDVRPWEPEEDDEGALGVEVICSPSDLHRLTAVLTAAPHSHVIMESESKMVASGALIRVRGDESTEQTAAWLEEEDVERLDNLLAALEEGADCQRVWSNVDGWPA